MPQTDDGMPLRSVPLSIIARLRADERNCGSGGPRFITDRATSSLDARSGEQKTQSCDRNKSGEPHAPKCLEYVNSIHCVSFSFQPLEERQRKAHSRSGFPMCVAYRPNCAPCPSVVTMHPARNSLCPDKRLSRCGLRRGIPWSIEAHATI